jgi:transformation/transcription domain-associated protein
MLDAGKSLCSLLKMVFSAFPLEAATTPQDMKLLHQRVQELIHKNLAAVTTQQIALEPNSANSIISFSLFVLNALAEVQKNFIDPFIGLLFRVLQRHARDMGSSAGGHIRQVC